MISTRDIDASIKVVQPGRQVKAGTVTTTSQQDIADIKEKERRAKIIIEKKEWEEKIKEEEKKRKAMAKIVKPTKEALDAMKKIGMKDKMAKVRAAKKK